MLDQLRLESYGLCCKMKVTTAVTLLGFAGITISIVAIIAGFLAALDTYILVPFILIRPLFFFGLGSKIILQHISIYIWSFRDHHLPHPAYHEHLPHPEDQG